MKKLLFPLCAVVLLNCSVSTKESLLERGKSDLKRGALEEASLQFRRAIQKDSAYAEAYYWLGKTEIQRDKALVGYSSLVQAAKLKPSSSEIQSELGDVSLRLYFTSDPKNLRFLDEVKKAANNLMAADANSVEGFRLQGQINLAEGKPAEAVPYLEKANASRANDPGIVMPLAQALFSADRASDAEKLLKQLISAKPDFGPGHDLLVQFYLAKSKLGDAEAALVNKVNANPSNETYRVELAAFYTRANRKAEREATLAPLLTDKAKFPNGYFAVAAFKESEKSPLEAVRLLEDGMKRDPERRAVYARAIGKVLYKTQQWKEARDAFGVAYSIEPNEPTSAATYAQLLVDHGERNDIPKAVGIFQTLLKANDNNAILRFHYGRALLAAGKKDEARKALEQSLRERPSYLAPRFSLAQLDIEQGRNEQAEQHLNEILRFDPDNETIRLMHAVARANLGKYEDSRLELTNLRQKDPDSTEVGLQLGRLNLVESNYKEALQMFENISKQTNDIRSIAGMVEVHVAQRDFEKALEMLNQQLAKYPERSELLRRTLAATAVRINRPDLAVQNLKPLLEMHPGDAGLYVNLAEAQYTAGDIRAAAASLAEAAKLGASGCNFDQIQAAIYLDQNQRSQAIGTLRHCLSIKPDDATAMNNLAMLLSEDQATRAEAKRLIDSALRFSPNSPSFADTLGYVYLKSGSTAAAIRVFEILTGKDPENSSYQLHLAEAHFQAGDTAKGREALDRARKGRTAGRLAAKINSLSATAQAR